MSFCLTQPSIHFYSKIPKFFLHIFFHVFTTFLTKHAQHRGAEPFKGMQRVCVRVCVCVWERHPTGPALYQARPRICSQYISTNIDQKGEHTHMNRSHWKNNILVTLSPFLWVDWIELTLIFLVLDLEKINYLFRTKEQGQLKKGFKTPKPNNQTRED